MPTMSLVFKKALIQDVYILYPFCFACFLEKRPPLVLNPYDFFDSYYDAK